MIVTIIVVIVIIVIIFIILIILIILSKKKTCMIVTSYKQIELTLADVWNFADLIGFAVHILQRVHVYLRGFGLVYLCIWQIQKFFLRLLFLKLGFPQGFRAAITKAMPERKRFFVLMSSLITKVYFF